MLLLFKCSSHIQKSCCGGVVAVPRHAPAGQSHALHRMYISTQSYSAGELKRPLSHLSVVLICRALLNILAPMSSMLFPLRSTFLRQVLLPRALTSTVPRERRRDSVTDRDCRACRGREETKVGEEGASESACLCSASYRLGPFLQSCTQRRGSDNVD